MTEPTRNEIAVPTGYRSREAGLFLAQLDDQSRRLAEATRGISPAELGWQPAPGMNTIGMLLAHLAIVEVWWTGRVLLDREEVESQSVLGIGIDGDGMPIAEDGTPPAGLAGRAIDFYDDLLDRARAHLKQHAQKLGDADLERTVIRTRPSGEKRSITVRWTLYHILEHFAGHFGQILLLRHQYRVAQGAAENPASVR